MASVKVVVTCIQPGFRCAGRAWDVGETEAVLEDDEQLSVATKLAQLDGAKGGEHLTPETTTPCLLTYRIVEDPPPAQVPAVDVQEGSERPAELTAPGGESSPPPQTNSPTNGDTTSSNPPA